MTYRVLFPLDITDENTYNLYDIAIIPDFLGAVNPNWWHAHVECQTLEEGIKLGRKILNAYKNGKKCPCGQVLCLRTKDLPKYYITWAREVRKTERKV